MQHHRLYTITFLILIAIHSIIASNCDEYSFDIPFTKRVEESPIVLIGTSIKKKNDVHVDNLFNVTLLVSCILKGQPTQRIIHIVQAGSLLGRRSCQKLHINHKYIVFLEPFFDGTFRPTDFEEVPYTNQINGLLEKTCGLSRTYPYTEVNHREATLTNKCPPVVSIDCSSVTTTLSTTTSSTTFFSKMSSIIETTTKTTTKMATLPQRDPIDLAIVSLLLADQPQNNLNFKFFQRQNHKSLFSDEKVHNKASDRLSSTIINSIYLIIFNIVYSYYILE